MCIRDRCYAADSVDNFFDFIKHAELALFQRTSGIFQGTTRVPRDEEFDNKVSKKLASALLLFRNFADVSR